MGDYYFDGSTQFLSAPALVFLLGQAMQDDYQHNGIHVSPGPRGVVLRGY